MLMAFNSRYKSAATDVVDLRINLLIPVDIVDLFTVKQDQKVGIWLILPDVICLS